MGNVYGGGKCCQVNFDVDQNSHHPVPQPLVVTVAVQPSMYGDLLYLST